MSTLGNNHLSVAAERLVYAYNPPLAYTDLMQVKEKGAAHVGKKRVLFVDHTAQLGGGEIALANLVSYLDRDAIEPLLLLFSDGPLRERLEAELPVCVVPLSSRVLGTRKDAIGLNILTKIKDIASSLAFIYHLRLIILNLKVDIVHTNSLKADILGGLAARLARLPVVWHVRDRISPDYLPSAVVRVFQRMARVIPDRVIANSMSTLSTLRELPHPNGHSSRAERSFHARACVVHDGVRGDAAPTRREIRRNRLVVGIVGRISPWKGQDVFLKAAAIVRKQFPDTVFRVIGAPLFGERNYESQLFDLCRELDLAANVEFTGFIENVAEAIEDLDILVHASTLPEPFGQVIIEGMAACKPVVATSGGGVPEIVVDGVTGLLIPMKDVQAMADAIQRLIASPRDRQTMGENGRLRVDEHFLMKGAARKIERIYDNLLPELAGMHTAVPMADKYVVRPAL